MMFVYTVPGTYHADMIPGVSISFQTALSASTRRLPAHLASALTIHPREIQALWSHSHDTGSYDTLYQVDSSSSDVVIYWTMTGTHVVQDRQQYDGHTPITSCKTPSRHDVCLHHAHHADMITGVSISYLTSLSTSIRRLLAHPASALTIHPREVQALWPHNNDTGSYDTLYHVDSSSSDVVIYWTMTGKHAVRDR